MEIVKAQRKDFKRIVSFIGKVFHKRFPSLLPKLYTSDEICDYHFLAKEDGKILGTVASIPVTYHIPGAEIKAYGIGMVSVDPAARGKGVMDALLTKAVESAKAEGGEIAYLSGNRQRYERYGFVPSGSKIVFNFFDDNFKYMPSDDNITVKKGMDEKEEAFAKELHSLNLYRYDRKEFAKCLKSWHNKPFTVYYGEEFIGYGVMGRNKTVKELCLKKGKENLYNATIVKLASGVSRLSVEVEPYQKEQIKELSDYAGKFYVDYADDFCILNFASVLEKTLNTRKRSDGELKLGIDDKTYDIVVKGGFAKVEETRDIPDISMTQSQATMTIFSALSFSDNLNNDWFGDVYLTMSDPDNV